VSRESAAGTLTPPVSSSDHAEGPSSAPVTLVEYGDYECPSCGGAFPIVKSLQQKMGKEMRFVFRNFPLREAHPHALHAAIAAEAVGAHGEKKFWAMHDALYEHQDALSDADLAAYASDLEVSEREIANAFEVDAFADRVRADFRGGVRSGVNGTPTFFINGERYDGDWRDVPAFLSALHAAAEVHA
jgi:protein-disulfide isomerase